MSKFIGDVHERFSKKRDAVMTELDLEYEDLTDTESLGDAEEDDDSINDADDVDFNDLENEINEKVRKYENSD
jgi:hypothetical protein